MRFEKLDDAALAALKARNLPKLRAADIAFGADGEPADKVAENMATLDGYLSHFVELGERDPVWGSRLCICCGASLTGLLTGSFQWGLAHGEGSCCRCGYPARAIHRIDGIGTLSNLVLQYHPDELSFAAAKARAL